jgi:hypothetical protein
MSDETPGEFLCSRRGWHGVRRVWNEAVHSWDIVLVLDGHYSDEAMAEGMREWYAERLRAAMLRAGVQPEDPGDTYRYDRVSKDTRNRSRGL